MKKGFILSFITLIFLGQAGISYAQGTSAREIKPMSKESGDPIICYFTDENMFTAVPLRSELELRSGARTNTTQGANFEVDYVGFNADQQAAFQYAVDIWSSLLSSDVPIRISVQMRFDMAEGTLASTGWGGLNANFNNAQQVNTWYVVSLAEKIAGEELNDPSNPDIIMSFNGERDFYTGLDQQTPAGTFDLVSIALHEIGHGLGFYTHTFVDDGNLGEFGSGVGGNPTVYARNLENGDGENLFDTYNSDNPTTTLGAQLTGGDLYFRSSSFNSNLPRIYAPSEWNSGSSISHLNEGTYAAGTPNSLMTPQIGFAESVHDPGISLIMLEDMGWISMDIDHDALLDTEELGSAYPVVAAISGDNPVAIDGVDLVYTYTNWTNSTTVSMTETGNPAEYAAEIPSAGGETLVSYYITVADTDNKVYTSPGEAPEFFYQFAVATDTIAPTLLHQPLNIVFTDDPIARIVATGADNIGLNPMLLTYRINGGSPVNLEVTPATESKDGYYIAEYYYEWDLGALGVNKGDVVEYKLSVTDVSGSAFEAIHPSEDIGFNEILIDELNPAVSLYANDFNSADGDFVGVGFEIGSVTGFSSGILHSDHPYRELPGSSSEDTLILYQLLKTPIKISEFDPSITFEEVVLVEPGEDGSVFGDDDFWDYVVVEGSRDYGVTWQPFTDGYDCGAYADWKTHYNSDLVTKTFTSPDGSTNYPDSEAEGTETLFKFRQIDMLENGTFEAGEEVLIRFKIYADQLAAGWGWAIDNLKIQIDDEAPLIAHIATDYLPVGATELTIFSKISDNVILDSVTFELELDGNTEIIGVDEEADLYELTLPFSSPLTADSELKYRIIAVDSAANPNTTYLPETGFFEIPIAVLGEVKTSYENDFNTASTDFYGANFGIGDESGFDDPAIHSLHPYSNSPEGTSTMSYLLKYPIQTNTSVAWMSFDEVVLVNPFGDGVTVQVSNDNGANWYNVLTQYGSNSDIDWNTTYLSFDVNGNSIGEGSSLLYKNRLVNLLDPAEINGGDEILVRFTLSVNDRLYAWGWAIDNLEIQGITTAIEDNEAVNLSLYPNPTQGKQFVLKASGLGMETTIVIRDMLGKSVLAEKINPIGGSISREYNLEAVKPGLYLVSVDTPSGIETTRLILR